MTSRFVTERRRQIVVEQMKELNKKRDALQMEIYKLTPKINAKLKELIRLNEMVFKTHQKEQGE